MKFSILFFLAIVGFGAAQLSGTIKDSSQVIQNSKLIDDIQGLLTLNATDGSNEMDGTILLFGATIDGLTEPIDDVLNKVDSVVQNLLSGEIVILREHRAVEIFHKIIFIQYFLCQ
ncbi:hypothetical protein L5515_002380 [Caenorhabditis briggsae]|uniref:Uncharacterized protein n=1 Tax=Caenorhabditis briggsae TaxID=6238 RepID=A0AAE9J482_CAEBR|nr:hypothetical protein L5515_002380 [Caenorhabditis briggsae]